MRKLEIDLHQVFALAILILKGNMIEHNLTERDREAENLLVTNNHFVNFIQTIFQSRQLKEHNTQDVQPSIKRNR